MTTPVNKTDLLEIIEDIKVHVEHDNSFEGFLNYLMPNEGDPEGTQFRVEARYRVGNSMGQGGMVMLGVDIPTPQPEQPQEPLLGLATTRQMIEELIARMEMDARIKPSMEVRIALDDLEQMRHDLTEEVLNYRTVDS